jgi:BirA family biotin operon repressor/biotin-[acetyl-CoA-carboxylase] ligase
VDYAIIGIGVNVNLSIGCYPQLAGTATSLREESGKYISTTDVVRQILVEMDGLYQVVLKGSTIFEEWKGNLVNLGKAVYLETGNGTFEGVAESVSEDGGLLVRGKDNSLSKIVSGDVVLHRYCLDPPSPGKEKGDH